MVHDRSATIALIAGIMLPVLIGIVALVAEYGGGLLQRVENQRVADLAAYAAALAYDRDKTDAAMNTAAHRVAALNGIAAKDMTVDLVASPRTADRQAVSVDITTPRSLVLAPILGVGSVLNVSSAAFAELGGAGPGNCILALDEDGSGVTLKGGTHVRADDCVVASNATVTSPCGTGIVARKVTYDSDSAPSQPSYCRTITTPDGAPAPLVKVHSPDPFADSEAISRAATRLAEGAALTAPEPPASRGGTSINFAYNRSQTEKQARAAGCAASFSSPKWTLTCAGTGPFDFGSLTMGGGIKVDFNTGGSPDTEYNFSGPVKSTGSALTFGDGTFNLAEGLSTGGGSTTHFGAGAFRIARNDCGFSICNNGGATLTLDGPSTFELDAGVLNQSGTLVLGDGTTNAFRIGASSDGHAIHTTGGSKMTMADVTGGAFQLTGDVVNEGGSCLTLSASGEHDIRGSISAKGGLSLGAGVYFIDGYVALGENGGGSVYCNGKSIGMDARDVTLVLAGSELGTGYPCRGKAFCIAAGYSNVTLVAPKAGDTAGIALIGPTANNAGASLEQGAIGVKMSGLFYFPNGPVSLNGGAGIGGTSDSESCLQIVGSEVSLGGGTSAASDCSIDGVGGSGDTAVALVQ